MFRAHSPYSPFFTSGLLSSARQDSFPADYQSTIYLDVVFSDDDHYRSFLSLDLAETQSMRSLSLKRKASSKHAGRSSDRPRPKFDHTPEVPPRDSQRSMPSPKPVPSMTLPPPPMRSPIPITPPRLPSLPPLPSLELDLSPKRKSTCPKKNSIASTKQASIRPPTRQSSTVSTRTRMHNRAAALALLEGRQKPAVPPSFPRQELKNFMSMSDDEEDDEEDIFPKSDHEDDVIQLFNPSFEPEDIVLPTSPTTYSFPPSRVLRPSNGDSLSKLGGRKASQRKVKHKSGKPTDWFPLKSFIDLRNENDDEYGPSWNWRSFIEVTSVS
ncbi:hypothetical protein P691DRAFT_719268 [Macrolepiota fuliginosa MF-IS2]|uniref:Uncharacterized protein n=1 Tax=Macrolepiota fuliginosa MF-IS2 TaxID=1400762 RepID=A0A9P5XLD2_9AGAR|nr:hypothetical protein P691DRAFT_719268 [Macrolepiota fuliginosa MF-IS2]